MIFFCFVSLYIPVFSAKLQLFSELWFMSNSFERMVSHWYRWINWRSLHCLLAISHWTNGLLLFYKRFRTNSSAHYTCFFLVCQWLAMFPRRLIRSSRRKWTGVVVVVFIVGSSALLSKKHWTRVRTGPVLRLFSAIE